jgi:hypothetical protein
MTHTKRWRSGFNVHAQVRPRRAEGGVHRERADRLEPFELAVLAGRGWCCHPNILTENDSKMTV